MACLIKPAEGRSKGVVTLTTAERDNLIFPFGELRTSLERLKQNYFIGLHHNWHDYNLNYDSLFDFHLAGDEDLKEVNGKRVPLIPMDACNFSPNCFVPGNEEEKFWDILFVARAVEFKGIPEFFSAIRKLYDDGKRLRVLFICPIPPDNGPGSIQGVRKIYERMFFEAEQEYFTLLTTDFRYPFPFDLPTLAHFYRASRIFVHSAQDERRCRVAAYAWACGMPVVGMAPVGSVLSPALRQEPYFYETASYADFPNQILKALEASKKSPDFKLVRAEVATSRSASLFEKLLLDKIIEVAGEVTPSEIGWFDNLDIRLGRHHGLPAGVNTVQQDIAGFFNFLLNSSSGKLEALANFTDPELEIARLFPSKPRKLLGAGFTEVVKQQAINFARSMRRRF